MYKAALSECDHNLELTSLTDELRHESMQVDLYKYRPIYVCAVTKYLIDAQKFQGLHHRKPNPPSALLLYNRIMSLTTYYLTGCIIVFGPVEICVNELRLTRHRHKGKVTKHIKNELKIRSDNTAFTFTLAVVVAY